MLKNNSSFRRQRRARWISLTGSALIAVTTLAVPQQATAADFTVTSSADTNTPGTLRYAIAAANAAGAGNHTISFSLAPQSTIELGSPLELIQANITIDGGNTTIRGTDGIVSQRIFFVDSGNVTLKNFTLQEGVGQGGSGGNGEQSGGGGGGLGAGGAIFVNAGAAVTVEHVTFSQNSATGGQGGNSIATGNNYGGGGGGGLGGNGGNFGFFGGGGGGGLNGAGGTGNQVQNSYEGGGGGGIVAAGSDGTTGTGGSGGSPGGDGGTNSVPAGNATAAGGGGGGGGIGGLGGTGSDFGGGGGGGYFANGNNAGFGGGGGGAGIAGSPGTEGFGGSAGSLYGNGAGGGNAYGGAIFVRAGGTLTIVDSTFNNNSATGGIGGGGFYENGSNGAASASGVYVMSGTALNFSVSASNSLSMADTIGGDGGLRKTGSGELLLTGTNTYAGGTTVEEGRLAINGTQTGNVTVDPTGNLGGSGTITGDVINNGIVSAGNSIGTLNVGSFTQGSTGRLDVEINAAGQSDLVNVSGNVTLDGTVNVQAEPGVYTANTSYTFLTYSGNRSGTFSGITDNLAFFDAVLQYGANDVSFFLQANSTNYSDLALTLNERAVAAVLDHGILDPTLNNELRFLTTEQVRSALNELGGAVYGTSVQMQFQNSTNQVQLLTQHVHTICNAGQNAASDNQYDVSTVGYQPGDEEFVLCCRNDGRPSSSLWATSYGLGGTAQSDGNAAGLRSGQGGILIGRDHWYGDDCLLGIYGGYNYAQLDGEGLSQSVTANSGQFGAYLRRNIDTRHFLVTSGFGFDDYSSSRNLAFGNFNATADGNYDGWQAVNYGEVGQTVQTRWGKLQPYAALQYIYLRQNGFTETGAGPANLDVSGIDAHSLRSILGARFDRRIATRSGRMLIPQVRAGYLHEFLDSSTLVNNRFGATAGSSFAVQGLNLGRDWALLGTGLGWQFNQQLTLTANYDAQVNAYQTFHVGSANLQYVW